MQGRSLIRTVEWGLAGAALAAAGLLGLLVWSAHQLDRRAGASEAEIVRQMLEPEIAEFRHGLTQAANDPQGWSELDRQRQGFYPARAVAGEREGRVAQLVAVGTTRQRLDRLREGYARGEAGKMPIDFTLLGTRGGEELALIAPIRNPDGGKPSLAVAIIDFSELAQRLERHSIRLIPLHAPGDSHGELHLTGIFGDTVAVLAWKSARASDLLRSLVLPACALVFALMAAALVLLLDRARLFAARLPAPGAAPLVSPLVLPHSPDEMRLAAARNPAKVASSMQVS